MNKSSKKPKFIPTPLLGKVLSVQSHVVSGYVGNKVATFIFQFLGFEVLNILTVQFSNHTGYKKFRGEVLNGKQLSELFEGLEENGLSNKITHVVSGYIGSLDFLKKFLSIVKKLQKKIPNLQYFCDPVIGEKDNIYVPSSLINVFRNEVIPLAIMITPNQFESEILCGINFKNEEDVLKGINWFHTEKGIKYVVITSVEFENNGNLTMYGSHYECDENGKTFNEVYKIKYKKITKKNGGEVYFSGCGDLTTSLLLVWIRKLCENKKNESSFKKALENTLNSVQVILQNTILKLKLESVSIGKDKKEIIELDLIRCRKFLENPEIVYKATNCNINIVNNKT